MYFSFPDYGNCIANLGCSVLKHYGIDPPNPTLPQIDRLLSKNYKNVVVLLLDGMGVSALEAHLPENGFLRRNLLCAYSSVFPPTTVAATTAVDSGLYPNQSAWLGWTGYFDEIGRNVVYYSNVDDDTGEKLDFSPAWTYVPYDGIAAQVGRSGIASHYLAPFVEPYPKSFGAFCAEIERICGEEEQKYLYAYWDDPDRTMHRHGVDGEDAHRVLTEIEQNTEQLAEKLKDTLLIITADHGHINTKNEALTNDPEIAECLVRMPSIEPRALNLFIKEGMHERFEQLFKARFGDQFLLLTKKEVLEKHLFGIGNDHPRFEKMLGDYLAVATGNTAIFNSPSEPRKYKGGHAGLTENELTIPLIAVER